MMSDADGSTTVTLQGYGISDPNGGALTFAWYLNNNLVSTNVSFNYNLDAGDFTFFFVIIIIWYTITQFPSF